MFIDKDEARRGAVVFDSPLALERAWGYWLARLPKGWEKDAGVTGMNRKSARTNSKK
jgi:hypothetical protein